MIHIPEVLDSNLGQATGYPDSFFHGFPQPPEVNAVAVSITPRPFAPRSRDSSLGIATDCGLDGPGSIPRFFSSPQLPDRYWGSTQPPMQWIPWALSPGVKRQGQIVELYLNFPICLHGIGCH
jgi:hypothetical protein